MVILGRQEENSNKFNILMGVHIDLIKLAYHQARQYSREKPPAKMSAWALQISTQYQQKICLSKIAYNSNGSATLLLPKT